ncbi:SKP1-like protein 12 [Asparagus officinalis]|uniref:SKP1-like protein 12 n=1 Tax=Asparagus officinalis TaxID=4686 RepID=UPI00098E3332|nr:SKP1-like protein 12 [Asparagus officinalis]
MASSSPAPSREKRPSAAVNGGGDAGGPKPMERSKKTVVLRNKGPELFEVEEAAARLSVILGHQIDNGYDPIFADMQSSILTKIIEYCNKHSPSAPSTKEELDEWDSEFAGSFDFETLLHLVEAANYLSIKGLFDLVCKTIAGKIEDKSVDVIRTMFNIKNDFTLEEEKKLREECYLYK